MIRPHESDSSHPNSILVWGMSTSVTLVKKKREKSYAINACGQPCTKPQPTHSVTVLLAASAYLSTYH